MTSIAEKSNKIANDLVQASKLIKEKRGEMGRIKVDALGKKLHAAARAFHSFLEDVYGYEIGSDSYGDACPTEFDDMSVSLSAFAHVLKTIDAAYRHI